MQVAARILINTPLWVFALLQWPGAASRMARGGTLVCLVGAFSRPPTARRRQKKRRGHSSGQRDPAGSQHHDIRAAIWGRGCDRHEARASCRRGDHRPRRLRRQCGLFLRLDRGALAPLQEFRFRRKLKRTPRRLRVRGPLRHSDGFLVDDFSVRSLPVLCTFERGSAKPS